MLGPSGRTQMTLQGGERIFSRKDTRELVSKSLATLKQKKSAAQLKELGKRVIEMLDQQDRNEPEYVHEFDEGGRVPKKKQSAFGNTRAGKPRTRAEQDTMVARANRAWGEVSTPAPVKAPVKAPAKTPVKTPVKSFSLPRPSQAMAPDATRVAQRPAPTGPYRAGGNTTSKKVAQGLKSNTPSPGRPASPVSRPVAAPGDSSQIYAQQLQQEQQRLAQFRQQVVAVAHERAKERGGLGALVYHRETRPEKETYGKMTTDLTCIQNGSCTQALAGKRVGYDIKQYEGNLNFMDESQRGVNGYREIPYNQKKPGDYVVVDRIGSQIKHMMTYVAPPAKPDERGTFAQDHGNNGAEPGKDYYGRRVNAERGMEVGPVYKDGWDNDESAIKYRAYEFTGLLPAIQKRKQQYEQKKKSS